MLNEPSKLISYYTEALTDFAWRKELQLIDIKLLHELLLNIVSFDESVPSIHKCLRLSFLLVSLTFCACFNYLSFSSDGTSSHQNCLEILEKCIEYRGHKSLSHTTIRCMESSQRQCSVTIKNGAVSRNASSAAGPTIFFAAMSCK